MFQLKALKSASQSSCCAPCDAEHPIRNQNPFFTPALKGIKKQFVLLKGYSTPKGLTYRYAHCNDCVTYPFEGPPNARSNTCIGFNNCLNFLTNLTPWEKKDQQRSYW